MDSNSLNVKRQTAQIVDWTKKQFWRMKEDRAFIERQWYLNLAMFYGKQYVSFRRSTSTLHTNTSLLYIPPAPPWRVRAVVNRIRPTIRTEIAQLTNNKPNATVIPASAEERDMYAAMAAEQIWEHLSSTKKFKSIIRRAMWWNQVCGNGYIKTYWDFNKGEKQINNEKMGEICFVSETPFHIFVPDLLEEEIENQPYIIHAQLKPVEYIKLQHPNLGESIRTQETTGKEIFEAAFLNLIGATNPQKQESVLQFEVYIKPGAHSMFPEGATYTVIGDQIVYHQIGLPYSHNKYPFAKFDHIPSGKYYSTSSVEDLVPLQKEYNRTYSQIVENKNRMAKLQLMYEEGSIDPKKITTEPGQAIPYRPGFNKPEAFPSPGLPAYVPQIMDRIIADWNDISGQHEVTHGQVPPGVTAATAISFLQERDETKMSPTFDSLEEGIEKTAQMALVLIHDYWSVEETIKITGPEGSFDALTFKGSDLGENLDIRIEGGSSLPNSKAARQAFIMDLLKLGLIKPEDGLDVLNMGGLAKLYERFQIDRRQAQRENLRMSKATPDFISQYEATNQQLLMQNPMHFGQEPVIDEFTGQPTGEVQGKEPPLIVSTNTWDNHEQHIKIHNDFRKTQAFELLSPETKMLFEAHVNEHLAAIGVESVTLNPRAAAGLPPTDPYMMAEEGQQPQQSGMPGPMPEPELSQTGVM